MSGPTQLRQSRGHIRWRFPLWPALAAILVSCNCFADVRSKLSSDNIGQGETVQLRLDASGSNLQPPDLSVLDSDFTIVDRRVQRSRSVINGRSRERVGLTLILLPKRAGTLEIPPIQIGTETTHALQLTVAGSATEMQEMPEIVDDVLPQTAPPWENPTLLPWSPYDGSPEPLYPGPQELVPELLEPPLTQSPPAAPADLPSALDDSTDSRPAPTNRSGGRTGTLQDPWFWATLTLAIALLLLLFHRRTRGPVPTETTTPAPSQPERPVVESPTITAIRIAYETADAVAARDALLTWGRDAFPDDPPSNLVRLATRCGEPARTQITLLEQASYSPTPLEWNGAPVWKWLQSSELGTGTSLSLP